MTTTRFRSALLALGLFLGATATCAHEPSPFARAAPGGVGVAVEIKVTDLGGELPPGHDPDAFAHWAVALIRTGFEVLAPVEAAAVKSDDRLYFLDFHPYRSPDGGLFVSTALYTEFDCVTPAYRRYDGPCSGSWEELAAVFALAARDLEDEVLSRLESPEELAGVCELDAHPEEPAAAAPTGGGATSLPGIAP